MAVIAKSGSPSLSTAIPPTTNSLSGLYAGEAIQSGDACFIKTSDGKVYRSLGLGLGAPLAPALSTATSGGTVAAGTYGVKITYVNANGESLASEAGFISPTGSTSTITVASPAAAGSGGNAATKYKVYIAAPNGGPYLLQNGAGTNIGTGFTLTAPPVTNTAAFPNSNTTGAVSSVVDGFALSDCPSGEVLSLYWGVNLRYGASLSPGSFAYLDDTTPGALNDSPTALGTVPIGRVIDATRIWVRKSY